MTVYENCRSKVKIICPTHGEFEQTPKLHLKGAGCGKCVGTAKSNTKEFIETTILKLQIRHIKRHDYKKSSAAKKVNTFII